MSSTAAPTLPTPDAPWRAGVECARRLAWPGFVLVAMAAGVVAAYYRVPAVHAALAQLAEWRAAGGFAFSAGISAVFAGLIPFLYLRLHPATAAHHPWAHGGFFGLFWAYKGLEVDLLYRWQSRVFGDGPEVATIAAKTAVDQLVYNPVWAAPLAVILYGWKDAGFRWAAPLGDLRTPGWYARRVLPVMIAVWGVWVPGVACIYALPLPLQLPLCCLVNCFWVILFSLITARTPAR